MIRQFLLITILALGLTGGRISAVEASIMVGVVNFSTCITESKYGKNEQTQLESIKSQWSSLIEETEKELKSVAAKMEDQEYVEGLSPEAEEELKVKYKALNEDMAKYQNQLYQVLNQANYFFIQKMASYISKASEQVAQEKNLQYVLNKEACFFNKPELEVTKLVIAKMDINYEKDVKSKKISENEAIKAPAPKETAVKEASKEPAKEVSKKETKDAVKEAAKEPVKEVAKKETKDAVKEVAKEPAKEVSKKETKDAVKEVAKEPAKEVSKKETKDAIKDALKDIAKELSKKETKDISNETAKETTKDAKKELNQK